MNARINRILGEINSGRALAADAIAHEMSGEQPEIPGVVECWGEVFQFIANRELATSAGGWCISTSQIERVWHGDEPGELVITFRPPARFRFIVVMPLMHEDKWRALSTC
ncbi:hypothetical protein [Streptomyces sp. NPDC060022]|uniref:hypothetical protein n=1 Tax=Streptomyces sp. NPDC060022 TaxID=3347039 RepID=UPI0036AD9FC5